MADREQVERLLVDVSRRRDEAEADATKARDDLVRFAGGVTTLAELDPERIQAAADQLSLGLTKLRALDDERRDLRGLLS